MSPFIFKDYKDYLNKVIQNATGRGIKAQLADAAGCQRSFLSQVLNSHVHLTLDHAIGISEYLHLSETEAEFFYNLVGLSRAASPKLQNFYKKKMIALSQMNKDLSKRLKTTATDSDIAEYYSSWKYAAIHILCTIPAFQSVNKISQKLKLSTFEVEKVLKSLIKMELLTKKSDEYLPSKKEIHLPKNHFMTFTNHRNWRDRNLIEASKKLDNGISYSAAYSMSSHDFEKLREMTIEFLKSSRNLVTDSKEEELVGFTLDCVIFD